MVLRFPTGRKMTSPPAYGATLVRQFAGGYFQGAQPVGLGAAGFCGRGLAAGDSKSIFGMIVLKFGYVDRFSYFFR